jgi:hypothetical protein
VDLKAQAVKVIKNPLLAPVYHAFGGLCETWVAIFATATIILAFRGKLDGNFALAITAITGILTAHDALDDFHDRNKPQTDVNVVVNNGQA